MSKKYPANLDKRELATVLAALRFWQRTAIFNNVLDKSTFIKMEAEPEGEIATNKDTLIPLSPSEVSALCRRLNQ